MHSFEVETLQFRLQVVKSASLTMVKIPESSVMINCDTEESIKSPTVTYTQCEPKSPDNSMDMETGIYTAPEDGMYEVRHNHSFA